MTSASSPDESSKSFKKSRPRFLVLRGTGESGEEEDEEEEDEDEDDEEDAEDEEDEEDEENTEEEEDAEDEEDEEDEEEEEEEEEEDEVNQLLPQDKRIFKKVNIEPRHEEEKLTSYASKGGQNKLSKRN